MPALLKVVTVQWTGREGEQETAPDELEMKLAREGVTQVQAAFTVVKTDGERAVVEVVVVGEQVFGH
jgi:hypothetical protein